MKITGLRCTRVRIPLRSPFEWAQNRTSTAVHFIIEVDTDEGITGLGDAPGYVPDVGRSVERANKHLVGQDPFAVERINHTLRSIRATAMAIGAIDMALWDIIGKALDRPIFDIMGGGWREQVPVAPMIGINSPKQCAAEARRYVDELGVATIKLKLGRNAGSDVEIVEEVRKAVGPNILLRPDPNQAWSYTTAKRLIQRISDHDLEFVEQPIAGYHRMGLLKREVAPVSLACCDSMTSLYDLSDAMRLEAADLYNLDIFRAGGILNWIKAAGMIEAAGVRIGMHTHPHTGIAIAAQLNMVAATRQFVDAMDIVAPENNVAEDIVVENVFQIEDGCMKVPTGPGLGVTLDRDQLARFSVSKDGVLEVPERRERAPLMREGYY